MRVGSHICRFRQEERGAILVFWAIALAMILILVALSFDFGRVASTQSELQSYADQVALAAAGELDGRSDSITRAQSAAAALIADTQTFGNGATALAGSGSYALAFYATLPGNDLTPLVAPTTVPEDAVYARVVASPKTVNYTFAAAYAALVGAGATSHNVSAIAVAGFTQYACDITPLMFCLPDPSYKADSQIGDLILLRSGGNGAGAWQPGDFGFLDPSKAKVDPNGPCAGLNGAQLDGCLMGAEGSITQCFSQRGVDTEPGQKVGITDASFNVRFDMYQAIMNGKKNNPAYAPAANVIKGVVPKGGGSCVGNNPPASTNTMAMPKDTCFASGTCPYPRFGDGNWSAGRANYVQWHYAGTDPHPGASTRYEYYLSEIAAAGGVASSTAILSGTGWDGKALQETGRPQCSSHVSPDPDRRVVIAAGIDCARYNFNGRSPNIPVEEFFRLFLTQPVGTNGSSPPTLDLWAEVVGSAGGAGSGSGTMGGIFRDVVQLYR
jgi:Flp pilus assembly protein TadG